MAKTIFVSDDVKVRESVPSFRIESANALYIGGGGNPAVYEAIEVRDFVNLKKPIVISVYDNCKTRESIAAPVENPIRGYGTCAVDLPAITVEAEMGEELPYIELDVSLPLFDIAFDGVTGLVISGLLDLPPPPWYVGELTTGEIGSFAGSFPKFQTETYGGAEGEVTLPNTLIEDLPVYEITATLATGRTGTLSQELPSFEIEADLGGHLSQVLPAFAGTGTLTPGFAGIFDQSYRFTLTGDLFHPDEYIAGEVSVNLPVFASWRLDPLFGDYIQGIAELITGEIGTVASSLPAFTIEAASGMIVSGRMPAFSASGELILGQAGTVEVFWPDLYNDATLLHASEFFSALAANLPKFSLAGAGLVSELGAVVQNLPAFQIESAGGIRAQGQMPSFSLYSVLIPGQVGILSESLPALEIQASTALKDYVEADLPAFEIDGQGLAGLIGTFEQSYRFQFNAAGTEDLFGRLNSNLPAFTINAVLASGMDITTWLLYLPSMQISASGLAGAVGQLDESLPAMEASGEMAVEIEMTASPTFPAFTINATGQPQTLADAIQNVVVMNTGGFGVTEYTNYPFNSYFYFNGKYYGASPTGIYELGGDTDNGLPIEMEIEKNGMDFKSPNFKRATDAYITARADGDFKFDFITDKRTRSHLVNNGHAEIHVHKVKHLGRGLKSKYFGFNLKNLKGANLIIQEIELLIDVLSRKVM